MDILERLIIDGLASGLIDDTELEDLHDEIAMADPAQLVAMMEQHIGLELRERKRRQGRTLTWLQSGSHRGRSAPRE